MEADEVGDELPPTVAVDGGDAPVCYRLIPTNDGTGDGEYVVDPSLIKEFLQQLKEEANDG